MIFIAKLELQVPFSPFYKITSHFHSKIGFVLVWFLSEEPQRISRVPKEPCPWCHCPPATPQCPGTAGSQPQDQPKKTQNWIFLFPQRSRAFLADLCLFILGIYCYWGYWYPQQYCCYSSLLTHHCYVWVVWYLPLTVFFIFQDTRTRSFPKDSAQEDTFGFCLLTFPGISYQNKTQKPKSQKPTKAQRKFLMKGALGWRLG